MTSARRVVIDTNVLIVANEKSEHASDECVLKAVEFLEDARRESVVLLDSEWKIYEEYEKYCSYKGQPGVGDQFFLHLHRSQADPRRVQIIDVHPEGEDSYEEIPPELEKFDPSDKKFVAVAISDGRRASIVNCVDSDWSESAAELTACGITVIELCDCPAGPGSNQ